MTIRLLFALSILSLAATGIRASDMTGCNCPAGTLDARAVVESIDEAPKSPGAASDATPEQKFCAEFCKPAQIPIPGDEIFCKTVAGRGLVIYEGMRVTATTDGRYRVEFLAEAPPVETLFRLQLILVKKCGGKTSRIGTVTLRSVSIKPDAKGTLRMVRITQTGYSPYFRTACKCSNICVARVGTATFGSRPE